MELPQNIICIFAKPPVPGKTKSRLAADSGADFAAKLSKAMLLDIIQQGEYIAESKVVVFTPPETEPEDFNFLMENPIYEQSGEDLGQRMANAFRFLFSLGVSKAIIIGSDCISVSSEDFSNTFNALEKAEAVFKPAEDGGYLLIGLSQYNPEIFSEIPWGGSLVMEKTISILDQNKINYQLLKEGFDVDTTSDLELLKLFLEENKRENTTNLLKVYKK